MTPFDIYRKWESDITYTPPEEICLLLVKTSRAITRVEEVYDSHGVNTEAGQEALEVLRNLRRVYADLVLRGKALE